jgi:CcmD family protein
MATIRHQSVPRPGHWGARVVMLVAIGVLGLAAVVFGGQPPPSPSGQPDLVPFNQLPPGEQLPAAQLLIGAYGVVWLALLAYLWSIWRRLGQVERELKALARRLPSKNS